MQEVEPPASGGLLLCEIAARYIEYCEIYYRDSEGKPTSTFGNAKQAVTALAPFEDLPSTAFGPKKLQETRALLVQQGRSRKGCNTIVKAVKRLFRWAESQELVSPGHVHSLETVEPLKSGRTTAPESPPVKPVADSIVEATIKLLPKVVGDMVRIQRLTGARPGEVCGLRPGDIDRSGPESQANPRLVAQPTPPCRSHRDPQEVRTGSSSGRPWSPISGRFWRAE